MQIDGGGGVPSLSSPSPLTPLSGVSEAADSPLEETPDTALAQHKIAPSTLQAHLFSVICKSSGMAQVVGEVHFWNAQLSVEEKHEATGNQNFSSVRRRSRSNSSMRLCLFRAGSPARADARNSRA